MKYRAAWVLPICGPPLRDGWIAIEGGRIVGLGARPRWAGAGVPAEDRIRHDAQPAVREIDLGSVAILPGLVNAHTHLELSELRGQVPRAPRFSSWVRDLMHRRLAIDVVGPGDGSEAEAIVEAIAEARAAGTALVGDIGNTLASVEPLAASPLSGVVFYELIKFTADGAMTVLARARDAIAALPQRGRLRIDLTVHAPHTVAPALFQAVRTELDRNPRARASVHLAESLEEIEFLRNGTGPWRELLEDLGVWDRNWAPPGCGPVEYLDRIGFLGGRVLAVHGVQLTAAELSALAERGLTLVTCPRSNQWTGAGTPPVDAFYASGVRIAVGTDSLASAPDLNLFAELAALRALAPSMPASALLESATLQGARALGFDADFGSLEPGKRGELIAVDVPVGVEDVEEYLVSGIQPEQVRWLE